MALRLCLAKAVSKPTVKGMPYIKKLADVEMKDT